MHKSINHEIEILRGVSVILVILTHMPFFVPWDFAYWGPYVYYFQPWGGVDIFFAISGFVVTRTLVNSLQNSQGSVKDVLFSFWTRRFFRLIPLAWTCLAASILLSIIWNKSGIYGTPLGNIGDSISAFFYVANWHSWYCVESPHRFCGTNQLYWSLSLEEQFYMLLPLALLVFGRKIWMLSVALIIVQFPFHREVFSALWLTRLDAILWGVLISVFSTTDLYRRFEPTILANSYASFILLAVSLAVVSWIGSRSVAGYSSTVGLIAVAAAILVWAASYDKGFVFKNAAKKPILRWFGERSYAIYLVHQSAFFFVSEACARLAGSKEALGTQHSAIILIVGFALTLILSELAGRFIETPMRNLGRALTAERSSRTTDSDILIARTSVGA